MARLGSWPLKRMCLCVPREDFNAPYVAACSHMCVKANEVLCEALCCKALYKYPLFYFYFYNWTPAVK